MPKNSSKKQGIKVKKDTKEKVANKEVELNEFPSEREDEEGIHAKLSRDGQIGIRVDPI
jgi:hypothetical protein